MDPYRWVHRGTDEEAGLSSSTLGSTGNLSKKTVDISECVNGCEKPVQPPSKVLCKECFKELDEKMKKILGNRNSS